MSPSWSSRHCQASSPVVPAIAWARRRRHLGLVARRGRALGHEAPEQLSRSSSWLAVETRAEAQSRIDPERDGDCGDHFRRRQPTARRSLLVRADERFSPPEHATTQQQRGTNSLTGATGRERDASARRLNVFLTCLACCSAGEDQAQSGPCRARRLHNMPVASRRATATLPGCLPLLDAECRQLVCQCGRTVGLIGPRGAGSRRVMANPHTSASLSHLPHLLALTTQPPPTLRRVASRTPANSRPYRHVQSANRNSLNGSGPRRFEHERAALARMHWLKS